MLHISRMGGRTVVIGVSVVSEAIAINASHSSLTRLPWPSCCYNYPGGVSGMVMVAWTRSPLPASFCARTQTL